MNLRTIILGIVVIAVVAVGARLAMGGSLEGEDGGNSDSSVSRDDERLARSMCTDLEDGLSLFQMHAQAVEFYRETRSSEDGAQLASAQIQDLATREYCPEFREDFEATVVYEQWIKP